MVSMPRDYNGYKNCISRLGLPEKYEAKIAKFSSFDFENEFDFRKSIKSAASGFCQDLEFDNFGSRDDIHKKAYIVTGVYSEGQFKNSSSPKMPNSKSSSDIHSEFQSGFQTTILYIFGGFLVMAVVMLSIFFICVRLNRDIIPDKHVAEIHIKRDVPLSAPATQTQVPYQNTQPTVQYTGQSTSPALASTSAAPPSYHEVRQEYSNVPPSMGNPYSGKGPYQ